MQIIIAYNQIHWFCHICNTKADKLIQKIQQTLTSDLANPSESPLKTLQSSLSEAISQINNLVADAKD